MLKSDSTTINTEHTQVLVLKIGRDLFEGVCVEDLLFEEKFPSLPVPEPKFREFSSLLS